MKRVLLSLAVVAAFLSAHAEGTIATMSNQAGGVTRFTDLQCTNEYSRSYGYWGYVTGSNPSGYTITGCWKYNKEDGTVSVRSVGKGDIYTYVASALTMTEYAGRRDRATATRGGDL